MLSITRCLHLSQLSFLPALPPKFPYPFLGELELMGAVGSAIRPKVVDMSSKQAKFVENTVASNKVVIFSKTYCPYCKMAKDPFQKLNVEATIIELDGNPDGNEIQAVLGEITGARTVPRVFIDGKFVGGGTDIKRMFETGALQKYFQ